MCRCGGVKYALAGTAVADRFNLIYYYRANVRRTYIVNKKKKKWFFTKKKNHTENISKCVYARKGREINEASRTAIRFFAGIKSVRLRNKTVDSTIKILRFNEPVGKRVFVSVVQ